MSLVRPYVFGQEHQGLTVEFLLLQYSVSCMYCCVSIVVYLLFISWFECTCRWCIDKIGIWVSWSTAEFRLRLVWPRWTCLIPPVPPVILLTIQRRCIFVDPFCYLCFTFVLSYSLVCSLKPCNHLLGKGWPHCSLVSGVSLCSLSPTHMVSRVRCGTSGHLCVRFTPALMARLVPV